MSSVITDVKVWVTHTKRNYCFLKIYTAEGLSGVGDATLNGRELAVAALLREHLRPMLIGRDADDIEDIWQSIHRGTFWRGGPVMMTALAGVDVALWDLKGKRAGLPVYSLLGGRSRSKVRAYLHVHGATIDKIEGRARMRMASGCRALRVSFDSVAHDGQVVIQPHQDIETGERIEVGGAKPVEDQFWDTETYLRDCPNILADLRQRLGPDVALLHDVHERLTPIEAADLARKLEPVGLYFLEDPIRPEQMDSLRLIRRLSTTPIAIGELFFDKWQCLQVLQEQLADYIRVDVTHCGGITEVVKIAKIAEVYNVKLALHGPSDCSPIAHAANVHIDLHVPNLGIQEYVVHDKETMDLFTGGVRYEDGYLTLPDTPGLGIDLDHSQLGEDSYVRQYIPMCRERDESLHNW